MRGVVRWRFGLASVESEQGSAGRSLVRSLASRSGMGIVSFTSTGGFRDTKSLTWIMADRSVPGHPGGSGPGALKATAYAFGNASNHRSTTSRRQPTARDPWPPSLTGAGKSPSRTCRHNNVRDRPISASTAGVRKITGEEYRIDSVDRSERNCSRISTPSASGARTTCGSAARRRRGVANRGCGRSVGARCCHTAILDILPSRPSTDSTGNGRATPGAASESDRAPRALQAVAAQDPQA